MTIEEKALRQIELERADAARKALGKAADFIENYSTNEQYRKALKLGANLIRGLIDG